MQGGQVRDGDLVVTGKAPLQGHGMMLIIELLLVNLVRRLSPVC